MVKIFKYLLSLALAPVALYAQRFLVCNLQQSYPTLQDMAANLTIQTNALEIIRQSLYDYILYPLAGSLNLSFFATPQGAGLSSSPGNANIVKSLADTNMILPSQLPAPQAFWVDGIEVDVQPGSSAAANTYALQIPSAFATAAAATVQPGDTDVNRIYNSGLLSLQISQKIYYQEGPLYRFPTRHDLHYEAQVATTSGTAGQVAKGKLNLEGDRVKIQPGLGIMTSQNFGVNLTWPVLVALPTNNARIGVIMTGWLFRAVQ